METYLSVANGSLLFFLCFLVIAFVLFQAIVFMKKAWARGLELELSKETMKKVMINSCLFSILPSVPILIILLVLMPSLGKFFPWLRLSVVGSGVYENMAADVTAKAFGLSGIADPGFTLDIFVSSMWVMTIGIIWGPLYTALGSKYIQKGVANVKGKYEEKSEIIFSSMFLAMLAVFAGPYLSGPFKMLTGETKEITGMVPLLTFITSAIFIYIIDKISKKYDSKLLSEFSFPLGLVVGMGSAMLYSIILS